MLRIILSLPLALACTGSQSGAASPQGPGIAASAADATTAKTFKTANAYADAAERYDLHAAAGLFAAEFQWIGVDGPPSLVPEDRATWVANGLQMKSSMPALTMRKLLVLSRGDKSAVIFYVALNEGVGFVICEALDHANGGAVRQIRAYSDLLTLLHQTGVRPSETAPDAGANWDETIAVAASGSELEAANMVTVRRAFEAENARDFETIKSLASENLVIRSFANKKTIDRAAYFQENAPANATVDVESTFTSQWAAGDWVVSEARMTASFKAGPYAGKTGHSSVMFFHRIKDGKITNVFSAYNGAHRALVVGETTAEELTAARKKMIEALSNPSSNTSAPAGEKQP